MVEKLIQLYKQGVITEYELFSEARTRNLILPEEFREEFEKYKAMFDGTVPIRSFCIVA